MATKAKRHRPRKKESKPRHSIRPFWSGTITFGLVSVPVQLFPAQRRGGISMRMLDADGTPLSRQYYCPAHGRDVHPEHILRGYQLENEEYVIVRDDELQEIEPKKTREIDLRRFVDLAQIPPVLFHRAYYLTPSGDSTKAYRLLAEVMSRTERAGIASFVMRDKEYLVAIIADNGILCAETLRFQNEIRSPEELDLPAQKADRGLLADYEKAIKKLSSDKVEFDEFSDEATKRLQEIIARKAQSGKEVVDVGEGPPDEDEPADPVDLLETIRRSLRGEKDAPPVTDGKKPSHKRAKPSRLDKESKDELYERAKKRDLPGRSSMTRDQLLKALRKR